MKTLIFERAVDTSPESVGMRLYQVTAGFIAERFLVQGDETVLVQILPMSVSTDFDSFASADPHYGIMKSIYCEVRKIVWGE
ncbi:hypothetical protein [Cupriavidus necator]